MMYIWYGVVLSALGVVLYSIVTRRIPLFGIATDGVWSVSIYQSCDKGVLRFLPLNPPVVITPEHVTDIDCVFVADPFVLSHENRLYLFYEAAERGQKARIAVSKSSDGLAWTYLGIALREPFRLSYPYIFAHDGAVYMVPETRSVRQIRLYRAADFPMKWELHSVLVDDVNCADASIFQHAGAWYILTYKDNAQLALYWSTDLCEGWREHPASPVATDPDAIRPAGRILYFNGTLLRFSQSGFPFYGRKVFAHQIISLDVASYREQRFGRKPVLEPGSFDWNRSGMHHVDLFEDPQRRQLAAVDGVRRSYKLIFDGKW